ncbi:MAG: DUF559 domain-containing protein [Nocardioidaceae bacterium]|nr:DUF559 domain-containing protein [Nocardioidaceae bacterium]
MGIPLLPDDLRDRPFTAAEALAHGVTPGQLRGPGFRVVVRGVHVVADRPPHPADEVRAWMLVLPDDACLSHHTALQWRGLDLGPRWPLHFSTNTTRHRSRPGVVLHRRRGRLTPEWVRGIPVLGPDRTFVDCATTLGPVPLVTAGDWLVEAGATDVPTLSGYADTRHLDGVLRARRWVRYVRAGAQSPMETWVRLVIVLAGLPEPSPNVAVLDDAGGWLARGDLVLAHYRVLVEYDGAWHDREPAQRQHDLLRRERVEAAGWRVVVVTSADRRDPGRVARRVHEAIAARGYDGPPPRFSMMWRGWTV